MSCSVICSVDVCVVFHGSVLDWQCGITFDGVIDGTQKGEPSQLWARRIKIKYLN